MTRPQIIYRDGEPAFVVLPWEDYLRLGGRKSWAAMTDEEIFDAAVSVDEETFPLELTERLLAGESPVKVFREHRGVTQRALARKVRLNPVYLSQIESGRRSGSTQVLRAIATALAVDLDDLVPANGEHPRRRPARSRPRPRKRPASPRQQVPA